MAEYTFENNELTLKPLNDLLRMVFFIPSYQRGYRWSKTQVKNLLDDVLEFRKHSEDKSKDVFYCLQPIIVSKKGNDWILIDGQQRLTTIYLILIYLKDILSLLGKSKYTLQYETRPNSAKYLDSLDEKLKYENIDFYHMAEAYSAVNEWFDDKDGNVKLGVAQTLLNNLDSGKNVQVIWYEIENKNANEIFTRINVGKIPLTNSELIKALFLKKDNFSQKNQTTLYLRQLEIASDWDRIENTLQNDRFWFFINSKNDEYDTRIEYIFDLMMDKKWYEEDFYTFYKFQEQFKNKDIDTIWKNVKQYFMTLEQWYNDRELYHLVGFLIHSNFSLKTLLKKVHTISKKEFKKFLKEEISNMLKSINIRELQYRNKHVKTVLLLFNIQTIIKNKEAHVKFPFDEYTKQDWDIEHIRSVKSDKPNSAIGQRKWLNNIYEYYMGKNFDNNEYSQDFSNSILKEVTSLLKETNFTDEQFDKVYNNVLDEFNENNEDDITDSISNLTLLDAYTNRSYKNAVFPIKRNRIIENDKKGSFVPICTKNVFLKYYSKKSDGLMFWQKDDAESYLNSIIDTLKEYCNSNENKNE